MTKNLKQRCLVQLLSNWFVHHTPLILFMLMICMLVIEPMVIFWSLCFMSCMCVHFFKDCFLRWRFEDSLSLFPIRNCSKGKGSFFDSTIYFGANHGPNGWFSLPYLESYLHIDIQNHIWVGILYSHLWY